MRVPLFQQLSTRRDAFYVFSLAASSSMLLAPSASFAEVGTVTPSYNPGESVADLQGALGGLKPGTGRPLNALIKMRSETGVERVGTASPLFKPGRILDQLRTADGGTADVAFAFPEGWTLAGGPNLDVRDVKQSDSAYVLAAPLPPKTKFDQLPDTFFVDVLLHPAGKYGQFGACDDRKVVASSLEPLKLPSGSTQSYRKLSLKFAPLTYNGNNVERRALISATSVGGTVFMLVAGATSIRWKKLLPELDEVQQSFRVIGGAASRA